MSNKKAMYTFEYCSDQGRKYQSRREWSLGDGKSYRATLRRGWMDECCAHMNPKYKPNGYWTLERCIADASRHEHRKDWEKSAGGAYCAAQAAGWLDACCEHMGSAKGSTDANVIYIWRDAGTDLHKVGITSERIGERRIDICKQHNDMDPRIVFMLKVADARAVESKLLELGTDPELDSSIDGYTEFRKLTDAELGKAVSIAYEAALAA